MKQILYINIGDVFDDLECVNILNKNIDGKNHTFYKMKCLKCGREKDMLSSTIRIKHGTTHKACGKGLKTESKIFYSRWQAMRTRTNNPNYRCSKDYLERGINSDEFELFIDFYDALYDDFCKLAKEIGEENVSLERVDVNKSYTKENCIWIHKKEQQSNTRKNVRFKVVYPDGKVSEEKVDLRKFALENSLNYSCIRDVYTGRLKEYKGYKIIKIDNDKV